MHIKTARCLTDNIIINIIKDYIIDRNWFDRLRCEYMYHYNTLISLKGNVQDKYRQDHFDPVFNTVYKYINTVKLLTKRIKKFNNFHDIISYDSIYFILRSIEAINALLKYYDLHNLIGNIHYLVHTSREPSTERICYNILRKRANNIIDIDINELLQIDQVRNDIKMSCPDLYNKLYKNELTDGPQTLVYTNNTFNRYIGHDCTDPDILYFNL